MIFTSQYQFSLGKETENLNHDDMTLVGIGTKEKCDLVSGVVGQITTEKIVAAHANWITEHLFYILKD